MKYFTIATLMAISYGLKLEAGDDVWGDAAERLDYGSCGEVEGCTECRYSYAASDYQCKDDTVYKYKNKCNPRKHSPNLCMAGEDKLCHWSFPADEDKNSAAGACRTVPEDYIEGEWDYGHRP